MAVRARFHPRQQTAVNGLGFHNTSTLDRHHIPPASHTIAATSSLLLYQDPPMGRSLERQLGCLGARANLHRPTR